MKAKIIVLVSGDVYEGVEIKEVRKGVLPKEMDSMVELSFGKTRIYINAAMIVSLEPDVQCTGKGLVVTSF
ncbi:hypothetical protein WJ0W_005674 [Paenibacillus melissococcoides]|uniref:Uncharacterized protein n=1 Tax=Paenibacillus melissococcoides TaxID=2912268 RepID=A0ABM9G2W3_9BACL|nr:MULTISPECIES: hypothetical protein [Paenibacillus]MEB9894049.1 hypothetical protein [Bacillus cereus]CAH8245677.1 hypothetical protein WJ0W_002912 [Paenibacillus melissococcoides]CAH8248411.1 hypothetical protein WJ0W_005674 [Paenibacillus melissococcoides]CAH8711656.1 hypothetical protein WDD9_002990 [Paenibacillus melissococcoides]CAH8712422.1 hypothetical protein HTL2_003291 [Paenibacillus melissococcoides]